MRNILVPTDFSAPSEKALRLAIDFARVFGARVVVLHALDSRILSLAPGAIATPSRFWESVRKAAEHQLEKAREEIVSEGVEGDVSLVQLEPTTAIVETAAKMPADLIVMGTSGASGIEHVLLGSTAERVIRTAPCPVITVKGVPA